ncbi:ABC-type sulfate/molybdate transport systems ATPase subunit [Saonia flava]|uniref:ABC-type sulfate/molybdate transport systems ATPase subunit n=1 Tax=Saonia flava TaxID=523696 RepID=A0A846R0F9_9FLAO|nr:ABC transporter ATP-binding protein [Saonia flava]NJB71405.1 ABC-type sulfate/molybdate transport systems ATPase subunit [Saonia flava]
MLKVDITSFSYDDFPVLKDVIFKIKRGEHVSIIGESGCGKSTLLKIIYGLLHVEKGEVFWEDTQVMGPNYNLVPGEPYMKYLSQDFDLMPFITVSENVSQFLSVFEPEELKKRTAELLEMIEMTPFANTKVKNLSGGQQQRVALARVLAQEPKVLLLDEPFGHIDNFRKNSLRRNLFAYLKKQGITVLTATHDHNDILPYADRIIVLKDNSIIADGTPENVYQNPKEIYVASLFGEASLIPIQLIKPYAELSKSILVYPQEFKVSDSSGLKVWVKHSYFKGSHYMVEGKMNENDVVYFNSNKVLKPETEVFLNVSIETINLRLKDNN